MRPTAADKLFRVTNVNAAADAAPLQQTGESWDWRPACAAAQLRQQRQQPGGYRIRCHARASTTDCQPEWPCCWSLPGLILHLLSAVLHRALPPASWCCTLAVSLAPSRATSSSSSSSMLRSGLGRAASYQQFIEPAYFPPGPSRHAWCTSIREALLQTDDGARRLTTAQLCGLGGGRGWGGSALRRRRGEAPSRCKEHDQLQPGPGQHARVCS
jgi:hypothetical protein